MKKIIVLIFLAAVFACNNNSDPDKAKGNADTTDSTAIPQDNVGNRDTSISLDSTMGYR